MKTRLLQILVLVFFFNLLLMVSPPNAQVLYAKSAVSLGNVTRMNIPASTAVATWAKTYGGSAYDWPNSISVTSDGGYIIGGLTDSFTGDGVVHGWVLKMDANGNIVWQKVLTGNIQVYEINSVQPTADGGFIAVGGAQTLDSSKNGAFVIKLDASGNTVWQKIYGRAGYQDEAYSALWTSDGGYILTGRVSSWGGLWICKLDNAGNILWQEGYGTDAPGHSTIVPTSDGNYLVSFTAQTNSANVHYYNAILKLDGSGKVIWQKRYGMNDWDYVSSVVPTSDGGYIFAGTTYSFGRGNGDAWVAKLDGSGNIAWQKAYGLNGSDDASSITPTSDGGYIISGLISPPALGTDAWIFKIDGSGKLVWQKIYGQSAGAAESVSPTIDGGYIAGFETAEEGAGSADFLILKIDANGNIGNSCSLISASSVATTSGSISATKSSAVMHNASFASISSNVQLINSNAKVTTLCSSGGGTTYSISGVVNDSSNKPVSGVTISDRSGHTTKTDTNGNYKFDNLPVGTYVITPSKGAVSFSPPNKTVILPSKVSQDFEAHKTPVILVHGFLDDPVGDICNKADHWQLGYSGVALGNFPYWLQQEDGFDVWIAHLSTDQNYTPHIDTNADCLDAQVQSVYNQTGNQPIILIGHSMGGVVSRAYLSKYGYRNQVRTFISLGSPHAGVAAQILEEFYLAVPSLKTCGDEPGACDMSIERMKTFNAQNPKNDKIPYYLIGGDKCSSWWLCPLAKQFAGLNDNIVGQLSAIGEIFPEGTPAFAGSNITRISTHETHEAFHFGYPWYMEYGPGNLQHTQSYNCVRDIITLGNTNSCTTNISTTRPAVPSSLANATEIVHTQNSHILSGQTLSHTIQIDTNGSTIFSSFWLTGTIGVTLKDPNGLVIDPTYAQSNPSIVQYQFRGGDTIAPSWATYAFTTTVPGVWTLNLSGTDIAPAGSDYRILASAESTRSLAVHFDKDLYQIGQSANITSTLRNASNGISGANIQVQLQRTDGVTDTLTLNDNGNGNYSGVYTVPNAPGYVNATITADANDNGTAFTRETRQMFAIAPQTAQLTNTFADHSVDQNGDQVLDSVQLGVGVSANTAGTYILSADFMQGDTTVAHAIASTELTVGAQTVTLRFDGNDIWNSRLNGPYTVTNLYIVDEQAGGVPAQIATNVHTTAIYKYRRFGPLKPILKKPANGATISSSSPVLAWAKSATATSYEILVRKNAKNGDIVTDSFSTISKFKTSPLTASSIYYWRVRACRDNACSGWSKWWSFKVQ